MVEPLLVVGLVVALFVGYNIGGANTGPAFGPAVGAGVLSKVAAAALMSVFFFLGAWTVGRRVVDTLGQDLLTDPGVFTIETSIVVLFFIGGALFIGNYSGAPASTSMTAVGAIAGLGVATNELDWAVMGEIAIWWIVAPLVGFWVSMVVGRYFYPAINSWIAVTTTEGALLEVDRSGTIPRLRRGTNTTVREVAGTVVVVAIACVMAFSAGTSNMANAIAPLYGAGVALDPLMILGGVAVTIGAFTIARRTLDTLGNDITTLPLTAAIVVAVISSGIVIGLSAIGIPASFVIIATMSIVGLGWGRATRTVAVSEVRSERTPPLSVDALAVDEPGEDAPAIGEEEPERVATAGELFDPGTTGRVIVMQNVVPVLSTIGAYATFRVAFEFWW
jgi:inorganic phosphate transporter, PiT family